MELAGLAMGRSRSVVTLEIYTSSAESASARNTTVGADATPTSSTPRVKSASPAIATAHHQNGTHPGARARDESLRALRTSFTGSSLFPSLTATLLARTSAALGIADCCRRLDVHRVSQINEFCASMPSSRKSPARLLGPVERSTFSCLSACGGRCELVSLA